MSTRRRLLVRAVTIPAAIAAFAVSLATATHGNDPASRPQAVAFVPRAGATPQETIARLQQRLAAVPRDHSAWASLGMAYVTAAKTTANPTYYAKAAGALQRSRQLEPRDNFVAAAGMSALANARHDFVQARTWARRGLAINPASAPLYGALADAETQLGHYAAAFAATQRMVDLSPDTASFARVSYSWELRGNLEAATDYMQRALEAAPSAGDEAFARYYLGEIAFNSGNFTTALAQHDRALTAVPASFVSLEGRAKAHAALGQTAAALQDFADLVTRVPQPNYLIEYGELLESLGLEREAEAQYRVFEAEQKIFATNGVVPDIDAALFYADHGSPARALSAAETGVRSRPFTEMHDAYAWALHANGRDDEALARSNEALALGTQNALLYYHRGMIEVALGQRNAARVDLQRALAINPSFNPLAAPIARAALDGLGT